MQQETGWKCKNCEHNNTSNSLICENCGYNFSDQTQAPTSMLCPVCGQFDAIQRLSAVVIGGKYYIPQLDGVDLGTSELARLLSPPPPPNPKGGLSIGTWIGLGLFFAFWPIALLTTNYLYNTFGQEYAEEFFPFNVYFEALLRFSIPASLVVFILVLGLMLAYHFITKNRAEKKYALEKPVWDQAIWRWNLAYYCHRDGIVFSSETDKICAAQDIYTFLYSNW